MEFTFFTAFNSQNLLKSRRSECLKYETIYVANELLNTNYSL